VRGIFDGIGGEGYNKKGFSGDQKAFQAKAIDPSTAAAVADVIQLMEGGPPMNDGVYQRKCQTVAGPFSSGKYAKHSSDLEQSGQDQQPTVMQCAVLRVRPTTSPTASHPTTRR
jgi:hypothetical protein